MTQQTNPPAPPAPAVPAPAPTPPGRGPTARVLLGVGAVVAGLAVLWAAVFLVDLAMSKTTTAHASYDAAPAVELVADGDVTVRVAEGGVEVDRIAHSGLRSPEYRADESADRLVVTHECDRWLWVASRCAGELDVTVPADTELVVRTSNGDVLASGLAGDVELGSTNGRIEATAIDGRLEAGTSNGDVTVGRATGDVELRSSNGSIEVSDVGGELVADTSNGRIEVEDVAGAARATTSNGRVEVAGVGGDVHAESSNGDVTVIGDGEPVALTIGTSNGDQTIEGPTDPEAARTVEIRSSNGDVSYLAP
jgi:hypothetical protein